MRNLAEDLEIHEQEIQLNKLQKLSHLEKDESELRQKANRESRNREAQILELKMKILQKQEQVSNLEQEKIQIEKNLLFLNLRPEKRKSLEQELNEIETLVQTIENEIR